jgi:hypothetical protein
MLLAFGWLLENGVVCLASVPGVIAVGPHKHAEQASTHIGAVTPSSHHGRPCRRMRERRRSERTGKQGNREHPGGVRPARRGASRGSLRLGRARRENRAQPLARPLYAANPAGSSKRQALGLEPLRLSGSQGVRARARGGRTAKPHSSRILAASISRFCQVSGVAVVIMSAGCGASEREDELQVFQVSCLELAEVGLKDL